MYSNPIQQNPPPVYETAQPLQQNPQTVYPNPQTDQINPQPIYSSPPPIQPIYPSPPPVQPIPQQIYPNYPPVQPIPQQIYPNSPPVQPIYPNAPLVQPSPQQIQPSPQLVQPSPQLVQPNLQLVQPSAQPIQPSPQLIQPTSQLIQPSAQPIQATPQPAQQSPQTVQPSPQQVEPQIIPWEVQQAMNANPQMYQSDRKESPTLSAKSSNTRVRMPDPDRMNIEDLISSGPIEKPPQATVNPLIMARRKYGKVIPTITSYPAQRTKSVEKLPSEFPDDQPFLPSKLQASQKPPSPEKTAPIQPDTTQLLKSQLNKSGLSIFDSMFGIQPDDDSPPAEQDVNKKLQELMTLKQPAPVQEVKRSAAKDIRLNLPKPIPKPQQVVTSSLPGTSKQIVGQFNQQPQYLEDPNLIEYEPQQTPPRFRQQPNLLRTSPQTPPQPIQQSQLLRTSPQTPPQPIQQSQLLRTSPQTPPQPIQHPQYLETPNLLETQQRFTQQQNFPSQYPPATPQQFKPKLIQQPLYLDQNQSAINYQEALEFVDVPSGSCDGSGDMTEESPRYPEYHNIQEEYRMQQMREAYSSQLARHDPAIQIALTEEKERRQLHLKPEGDTSQKKTLWGRKPVYYWSEDEDISGTPRDIPKPPPYRGAHIPNPDVHRKASLKKSALTLRKSVSEIRESPRYYEKESEVSTADEEEFETQKLPKKSCLKKPSPTMPLKKSFSEVTESPRYYKKESELSTADEEEIHSEMERLPKKSCLKKPSHAKYYEKESEGTTGDEEFQPDTPDPQKTPPPGSTSTLDTAATSTTTSKHVFTSSPEDDDDDAKTVKRFVAKRVNIDDDTEGVEFIQDYESSEEEGTVTIQYIQPTTKPKIVSIRGVPEPVRVSKKSSQRYPRKSRSEEPSSKRTSVSRRLTFDPTTSEQRYPTISEAPVYEESEISSKVRNIDEQGVEQQHEKSMTQHHIDTFRQALKVKEETSKPLSSVQAKIADLEADEEILGIDFYNMDSRVLRHPELKAYFDKNPLIYAKMKSSGLLSTMVGESEDQSDITQDSLEGDSAHKDMKNKQYLAYAQEIGRAIARIIIGISQHLADLKSHGGHTPIEQITLIMMFREACESVFNKTLYALLARSINSAAVFHLKEMFDECIKHCTNNERDLMTNLSPNMVSFVNDPLIIRLRPRDGATQRIEIGEQRRGLFIFKYNFSTCMSAFERFEAVGDGPTIDRKCLFAPPLYTPDKSSTDDDAKQSTLDDGPDSNPLPFYLFSQPQDPPSHQVEGKSSIFFQALDVLSGQGNRFLQDIHVEVNKNIEDETAKTSPPKRLQESTPNVVSAATNTENLESEGKEASVPMIKLVIQTPKSKKSKKASKDVGTYSKLQPEVASTSIQTDQPQETESAKEARMEHEKDKLVRALHREREAKNEARLALAKEKQAKLVLQKEIDAKLEQLKEREAKLERENEAKLEKEAEEKHRKKYDRRRRPRSAPFRFPPRDEDANIKSEDSTEYLLEAETRTPRGDNKVIDIVSDSELQEALYLEKSRKTGKISKPKRTPRQSKQIQSRKREQLYFDLPSQEAELITDNASDSELPTVMIRKTDPGRGRGGPRRVLKRRYAYFRVPEPSSELEIDTEMEETIEQVSDKTGIPPASILRALQTAKKETSRSASPRKLPLPEAAPHVAKKRTQSKRSPQKDLLEQLLMKPAAPLQFEQPILTTPKKYLDERMIGLEGFAGDTSLEETTTSVHDAAPYKDIPAFLLPPTQSPPPKPIAKADVASKNTLNTVMELLQTGMRKIQEGEEFQSLQLPSTSQQLPVLPQYNQQAMTIQPYQMAQANLPEPHLNYRFTDPTYQRAQTLQYQEVRGQHRPPPIQHEQRIDYQRTDVQYIDQPQIHIQRPAISEQRSPEEIYKNLIEQLPRDQLLELHGKIGQSMGIPQLSDTPEQHPKSDHRHKERHMKVKPSPPQERQHRGTPAELKVAEDKSLKRPRAAPKKTLEKPKMSGPPAPSPEKPKYHTAEEYRAPKEEPKRIRPDSTSSFKSLTRTSQGVESPALTHRTATSHRTSTSHRTATTHRTTTGSRGGPSEYSDYDDQITRSTHSPRVWREESSTVTASEYEPQESDRNAPIDDTKYCFTQDEGYPLLDSYQFGQASTTYPLPKVFGQNDPIPAVGKGPKPQSPSQSKQEQKKEKSKYRTSCKEEKSSASEDTDEDDDCKKISKSKEARRISTTSDVQPTTSKSKSNPLKGDQHYRKRAYSDTNLVIGCPTTLCTEEQSSDSDDTDDVQSTTVKSDQYYRKRAHSDTNLIIGCRETLQKFLRNRFEECLFVSGNLCQDGADANRLNLHGGIWENAVLDQSQVYYQRTRGAQRMYKLLLNNSPYIYKGQAKTHKIIFSDDYLHDAGQQNEDKGYYKDIIAPFLSSFAFKCDWRSHKKQVEDKHRIKKPSNATDITTSFSSDLSSTNTNVTLSVSQDSDSVTIETTTVENVHQDSDPTSITTTPQTQALVHQPLYRISPSGSKEKLFCSQERATNLNQVITVEMLSSLNIMPAINQMVDARIQEIMQGSQLRTLTKSISVVRTVSTFTSKYHSEFIYTPRSTPGRSSLENETLQGVQEVPEEQETPEERDILEQQEGVDLLPYDTLTYYSGTAESTTEVEGDLESESSEVVAPLIWQRKQPCLLPPTNPYNLLWQNYDIKQNMPRVQMIAQKPTATHFVGNAQEKDAAALAKEQLNPQEFEMVKALGEIRTEVRVKSTKLFEKPGLKGGAPPPPPTPIPRKSLASTTSDVNSEIATNVETQTEPETTTEKTPSEVFPVEKMPAVAEWIKTVSPERGYSISEGSQTDVTDISDRDQKGADYSYASSPHSFFSAFREDITSRFHEWLNVLETIYTQPPRFHQEEQPVAPGFPFPGTSADWGTDPYTIWLQRNSLLNKDLEAVAKQANIVGELRDDVQRTQPDELQQHEQELARQWNNFCVKYGRAPLEAFKGPHSTLLQPTSSASSHIEPDAASSVTEYKHKENTDRILTEINTLKGIMDRPIAEKKEEKVVESASTAASDIEQAVGKVIIGKILTHKSPQAEATKSLLAQALADFAIEDASTSDLTSTETKEKPKDLSAYRVQGAIPKPKKESKKKSKKESKTSKSGRSEYDRKLPFNDIFLEGDYGTMATNTTVDLSTECSTTIEISEDQELIQKREMQQLQQKIDSLEIERSAVKQRESHDTAGTFTYMDKPVQVFDKSSNSWKWLTETVRVYNRPEESLEMPEEHPEEYPEEYEEIADPGLQGQQVKPKKYRKTHRKERVYFKRGGTGLVQDIYTENTISEFETDTASSISVARSARSSRAYLSQVSSVIEKDPAEEARYQKKIDTLNSDLQYAVRLLLDMNDRITSKEIYEMVTNQDFDRGVQLIDFVMQKFPVGPESAEKMKKWTAQVNKLGTAQLIPPPKVDMGHRRKHHDSKPGESSHHKHQHRAETAHKEKAPYNDSPYKGEPLAYRPESAPSTRHHEAQHHERYGHHEQYDRHGQHSRHHQERSKSEQPTAKKSPRDQAKKSRSPEPGGSPKSPEDLYADQHLVPPHKQRLDFHDDDPKSLIWKPVKREKAVKKQVRKDPDAAFWDRD
nr:uncharacterized protein LOC111425599 [Onthophagus taurus]